MLALASALGSPFSFILWDLAQHAPFAHAIHQKGTASVGSIAFSPKGEQLVSVSVLTDSPYNGIFTLWDISLKRWQQDACAIANRNLKPDEWKQFINYQPYGKLCPDLDT